MSASRRDRKIGAVPVLGFTMANSVCGHGEGAFAFAGLRDVVQEETAFGGALVGFRGCDESAELEASMNVGEERRLVEAAPAVLKVVELAQTPRCCERPEKRGGSLVGGDAGRDQEPNRAGGPDELKGALDEQRIKVDVALGKQRIVAAFPGHCSRPFGLLFGLPELACECRAGSGHRSRQLPSNGSFFGLGNFRVAKGEPLDLRELDALPGRVADDSIEAALCHHFAPVGPDARKSRLASGRTIPGCLQIELLQRPPPARGRRVGLVPRGQSRERRLATRPATAGFSGR